MIKIIVNENKTQESVKIVFTLVKQNLFGNIFFNSEGGRYQHLRQTNDLLIFNCQTYSDIKSGN